VIAALGLGDLLHAWLAAIGDPEALT